MPKWTDYTIKTNPADNDEVMVLDTAGKANKRLSLSALSDWIIGKIANKVFENLQTQNKTILGAINELNSNLLKIEIGANESSIVVNVIDGNYAGGSFLLFGRSNPNVFTAAVFTCFRSEKSKNMEADILALDKATYNVVADNKTVTITGSRITAYSKFALLSADAFSQIFIQTK